MPSRTSYDIVLPAAAPRQLDPEDDNDAVLILVASQLARIVCRVVELNAFSWLQKELYGLAQSQRAETEIADLVQELGRTLLGLRWRISCWQVIEIESSDAEEPKSTCIDRIKKLCRILYIYYFAAQRKLPLWVAQELLRMRSEYVDAEPVVETLPHDETLEGFDLWMNEGHDMVRAGGYPRQSLSLQRVCE